MSPQVHFLSNQDLELLKPVPWLLELENLTPGSLTGCTALTSYLTSLSFCFFIYRQPAEVITTTMIQIRDDIK